MKQLLLMTLLTLGLSSLTYAKELNFGKPIDPDAKVKVSTLMATPDHYLNKTVTVTGMVVGVCEKRGCWMTIASDAKFEKLRIKVKDGEMVFPVSAKGHQALATGVFTQVKLTLEQTRKHRAHQAEHKGESFDPASVTEPMSYYQVVPVGVKILD